jgi:predicted Fe-Mo cluster-binding NifX family protein
MIAIPVMRARVAPVLNWCSRILIFPEDPGAGARQELQLPDLSPLERVQVLRQNGVHTLICGALSPELQYSAMQQGLKIISGVAGEIGEVLQAYREDRLGEPEFWLPGCRGPRRYRRGCWKADDLSPTGETGDKMIMPGGSGGRGQGRGPGGQGQGRGKGGRGQGQGGQGQGRRPGAGRPGGQGAGAQNLCRCPACGASLPHERGIPCFQVNCPQCGKPMVRE